MNYGLNPYLVWAYLGMKEIHHTGQLAHNVINPSERCYVCVCVCVLESHRLNDSCAPLGMAVLMGCSASSWSLCRTLWSCCSRSRCWSGKDQSGRRALQTRTFLSRWWWLSGSPSSVLETPVKRPAEIPGVYTPWGFSGVGEHKAVYLERNDALCNLPSCITWSTPHKTRFSPTKCLCSS